MIKKEVKYTFDLKVGKNGVSDIISGNCHSGESDFFLCRYGDAIKIEWECWDLLVKKVNELREVSLRD